MVLGWDAGDFKKTADGIRNQKANSKSALLATIDGHLSASQDQRTKIRKESIAEKESIVTAILKSKDPKTAANLSEQQHSQLLEYYSAQLSAQDRDKIVQVMCRNSPDHVTTLVREAMAAFDPIIRDLHNNVDLRKYVVNSQKIIDDILEVNKPKRDKHKKLIPPSIEDYVFLLRRHKKWWFEYLHEFAKGCPEVRDRFRDWLKNNVLASFRQPEDGSEESRSMAGAGSMTEPLRTIFAKLDKDTKQKTITALDKYGEYTNTLDAQSSTRLQGIVDGLQEKSAKAKDAAKLGSMKGPGVYHARWQWLLDETLITPATPSGAIRHGKDVKDVKARGKTGALASKDVWDLSSLPQLGTDSAPEPPDVRIVYEALGPQFRDIVANISSQAAR